MKSDLARVLLDRAKGQANYSPAPRFSEWTGPFEPSKLTETQPTYDAKDSPSAIAFPKQPEQPTVPGGNAGAPMPAKPTVVPPAWQRYLTSQKMIQGYQNNWQPNPMLTRILNGSY